VAAIDVTAPKVTFVESSSRDRRRVVVSYNDEGDNRPSLRDGGIKGREVHLLRCRGA